MQARLVELAAASRSALLSSILAAGTYQWPQSYFLCVLGLSQQPHLILTVTMCHARGGATAHTEFPSVDATTIAAAVAQLDASSEVASAGATALQQSVTAIHPHVASSARSVGIVAAHAPAEKRHQPCDDEPAPHSSVAASSALSSSSSAATPTVAAAAAATTLPHCAPAAKKFKPHRPFQWARFHQRHIALHIAYVGADYSGFAAANLNSAEAEVDVQIRRAETGADQLRYVSEQCLTWDQ